MSPPKIVTTTAVMTAIFGSLRVSSIARRQRQQDRRHEDLGGEEDLLELAFAGGEPFRHRRHAIGEKEDRDRPDLEEELDERMDVAFGGGWHGPDIAAPRAERHSL